MKKTKIALAVARTCGPSRPGLHTWACFSPLLATAEILADQMYYAKMAVKALRK